MQVRSSGWWQSFRVRMLLIIGLVATVPLSLMGLWLTGSASLATERLLEARVAAVLARAGADITARWVRARGELLDMTQHPDVRQAVLTRGAEPVARLRASVTVRGIDGEPVWAAMPIDGMPAQPHLRMAVPIHASPLGERIGVAETDVPLHTLLGSPPAEPGAIQILVGVFDSETGAPLTPLPFDWSPARQGSIEWGGDRWFLDQRVLAEPRLTLVGAAPIAPFELPLRTAAGQGLWILIAVSVVGVGLAVALTRPALAALDRLTAAAESVAAGALEQRVHRGGGRELERLADAFNRMTGGLRQTLKQLAEQRALARTGELAASIAHEVRNPLTAIRVDLQVADESLDHRAPARRRVRRALEEIDRLNRAVDSALLATRAARQHERPVDVRRPIESAMAVAGRTSPDRATMTLHVATESPRVPGDETALEQLFLNLLLNALEAVQDQGEITVDLARDADQVIVRVRDNGTGLTPDVASRAFEPFFTTRERGGGLGLTIAARLARAHGGSVELAPDATGGAVATVRLPAFRTDS